MVITARQTVNIVARTPALVVVVVATSRISAARLYRVRPQVGQQVPLFPERLLTAALRAYEGSLTSLKGKKLAVRHLKAKKLYLYIRTNSTTTRCERKCKNEIYCLPSKAKTI